MIIKQIWTGNAYRNIAMVHLLAGNAQTSLENFDLAIAVDQENGDGESRGIAYKEVQRSLARFLAGEEIEALEDCRIAVAKLDARAHGQDGCHNRGTW